MRLSKNVNGTQYSYLYLGGLLMQETRGSRVINYFYDANGQAIALRYRSSSSADWAYYYYDYNSRGDIVGLYAENGNPECTYVYDPWGKLLSVKNPAGTEMTSATYIGNLQSLKYRGYVYDNETGLYYLQSRYYDPVTRRFINADGLVSTGTGILGFNMFVYCENNPIIRCDPHGNSYRAPITITDSRVHRKETLRDIGSSNNKSKSSSSIIKDCNNLTASIIGQYSSGNIYIVDSANEDFLPDSYRDIVVVDYRNNEDPNMKIIDSYLITDTCEMREILLVLQNYNENHPTLSPVQWDLSIDEMLCEWKAHNCSYNLHIKVESTKSVDINQNDPFRWLYNAIFR